MTSSLSSASTLLSQLQCPLTIQHTHNNNLRCPWHLECTDNVGADGRLPPGPCSWIQFCPAGHSAMMPLPKLFHKYLLTSSSLKKKLNLLILINWNSRHLYLVATLLDRARVTPRYNRHAHWPYLGIVILNVWLPTCPTGDVLKTRTTHVLTHVFRTSRAKNREGYRYLSDK